MIRSNFKPFQFTVALVSLTWIIACNQPSYGQQAVKAELPLVWVLSTGGTIAGRGESSTGLTEYKSGSFLGEELVAAVPEIKQFVRHDRPVVLVGAQRPATAISADGPLNLLNAIRTAASPDARGKGVLIVMNEEINAARDVTKANTYRVEAFPSPELGYLGYADADKITFYRSSTKRHTINSEFDVDGLSDFPKVDILYSYIQPNVAMLEALIASGVKGIVFAGTGAGSLSSFERSALMSVVSLPAAERPVLVRSSRVGNGRVVAREEYDKLGMIPADTLNPQKARILLMLALTKTSDIEEIKRIFSEY